MAIRASSRSNTAAKSAAPVVISSSYLETLKKAVDGPFSLDDFREKTSRPVPAYTSSKDRMETMRKLDHEKHKAAASRVSSTSVADIEEEERRVLLQERARPVLTSIREARVETMSEVQSLNHKVATARVLDSWGKQLQIKERKEQEAKLEESMFTAVARERDMLAIERARQLEHEKRERERHAAEIIEQQLEERAAQRELELEAVELEAEQMKRIHDAHERAAAVARRKADEDAKRRREELATANAQAIRRKALRAEDEKRAELEVMHHMMEKAAMERARALEAERLKKEKEATWAKMLAKQQRILDKRGEEDEKRAKRHEEVVIMRERERAQREQHQRDSLMRKVLEERDRQLQLKAQLREEEKLREAHLASIVLSKDVEAAEREMMKRAASHEATLRYKSDLEDELRKREAARRAEEETKYRDRLAMQREEIRRGRALEDARQRKINQLRAEGVTDEALKKAGLM